MDMSLDLLKRFVNLFSRQNNRLSNVSAVSNALKIEASFAAGTNEHFAYRAIHNAISAIDRVHKDGNLPAIPVKVKPIIDAHGHFKKTSTNNIVKIAISYFGSHIELTCVHEIGHFLDFSGIDNSGSFASVNSPLLDKWRQAVKNSVATQHLGKLSKVTHATGASFDGSVVTYPVDNAYVLYLLRAQELWARSYSQFIATKSKNSILQNQLEYRLQPSANGLYYWEHWDNQDFLPIMAAIEAVFRQLGWMK